MTDIRVLNHQVIHRQPGKYIAWPTIARLPSGELLVGFSGDRYAHVCPYGKSQMLRSSDGGETWSDAITINDTPLDDRDAGLLALPDGSVLFRWFCTFQDPDEPSVKARQSPEAREAWLAVSSRITPAEVEQWTQTTPGVRAEGRHDRRGHWLRRSPDGGQTWDDPIVTQGTSPNPPAMLRSGRLLMIGNSGYAHIDQSTKVVVESSDDSGKSWSTLSELPMYGRDADGGEIYFCEPHLVEAEPNHIVAMARTEGRPRDVHGKYLYQADSHDGGETWTAWRQTELVGKPPHLMRLSDGRLLVTFGRRLPPFGQRVAISDDLGGSWREFALREDAPNGDLGYPATAELPDASLMSVYYQCESDGEKPVLMTTRWTIEG